MVLQTLINGGYAGLQCAVMALGFGLVHRTSRFMHFAHGAIFTVAAYSFLLVTNSLHLGVWTATGVALCSALAVALSLEGAVYRPLRRANASSLMLLLASFGAYALIQGGIAIAFGDEARSLSGRGVEVGRLVLGARVTTVQVIVMVSCLVSIGGVLGLLRLAGVGRQMRALAADPELALIAGIRVDVLHMFAISLATLLAVVAGVAATFDVDLVPTMGFKVVLAAVTAAIIGRRSEHWGPVAGGLVLGTLQSTVGALGFSRWQDTVVFCVLICWMLIRPEPAVVLLGGR